MFFSLLPKGCIKCLSEQHCIAAISLEISVVGCFRRWKFVDIFLFCNTLCTSLFMFLFTGVQKTPFETPSVNKGSPRTERKLFISNISMNATKVSKIFLLGEQGS